MGIYRQHKLSIIRHAKQLAAQLPSTSFIDLDAHANIDELPKSDFVGIDGFSMQENDEGIAVFVSYAGCTWADTDLMRLTTMMDTLVEALRPGRQVQLWMENPGPGVAPSWMKVAGEVLVQPTERSDQRAIQLVTLRLLSGQTGH
jgi:hypothetical protein